MPADEADVCALCGTPRARKVIDNSIVHLICEVHSACALVPFNATNHVRDTFINEESHTPASRARVVEVKRVRTNVMSAGIVRAELTEVDNIPVRLVFIDKGQMPIKITLFSQSHLNIPSQNFETPLVSCTERMCHSHIQVLRRKPALRGVCPRPFVTSSPSNRVPVELDTGRVLGGQTFLKVLLVGLGALQ